MTVSFERRFALVACSILICIVTGCRHYLPENFATFPLNEKVAVYEGWFAKGGRDDLMAREWISWHGRPAAALMIPYLRGEKKSIPVYEALEIIRTVQLRGCTLRGTDAEQAVTDLLKRGKGTPADFLLAEDTLKAIRRDEHFERYDTLPPGPCSNLLH